MGVQKPEVEDTVQKDTSETLGKASRRKAAAELLKKEKAYVQGALQEQHAKPILSKLSMLEGALSSGQSGSFAALDDISGVLGRYRRFRALLNDDSVVTRSIRRHMDKIANPKAKALISSHLLLATRASRSSEKALAEYFRAPSSNTEQAYNKAVADYGEGMRRAMTLANFALRYQERAEYHLKGQSLDISGEDRRLLGISRPHGTTFLSVKQRVAKVVDDVRLLADRGKMHELQMIYISLDNAEGRLMRALAGYDPRKLFREMGDGISLDPEDPAAIALGNVEAADKGGKRIMQAVYGTVWPELVRSRNVKSPEWQDIIDAAIAANAMAASVLPRIKVPELVVKRVKGGDETNFSIFPTGKPRRLFPSRTARAIEKDYNFVGGKLNMAKMAHSRGGIGEMKRYLESAVNYNKEANQNFAQAYTERYEDRVIGKKKELMTFWERTKHYYYEYGTYAGDATMALLTIALPASGVGMVGEVAIAEYWMLRAAMETKKAHVVKGELGIGDVLTGVAMALGGAGRLAGAAMGGALASGRFTGPASAFVGISSAGGVFLMGQGGYQLIKDISHGSTYGWTDQRIQGSLQNALFMGIGMAGLARSGALEGVKKRMSRTSVPKLVGEARTRLRERRAGMEGRYGPRYRELGMIEVPIRLRRPPAEAMDVEIPITRRRSMGRWLKEGEGAYLVPDEGYQAMEKGGWKAYPKPIEFRGERWRLVRREVKRPADLYRSLPEGSLWVMKEGKCLTLRPEPRAGSGIIMIDKVRIPGLENVLPEGEKVFLQEAQETGFGDIQAHGRHTTITLDGKRFNVFDSKPMMYLGSGLDRMPIGLKRAGIYRYSRHGDLLLLERGDFQVESGRPGVYGAQDYSVHIGENAIQIGLIGWKDGIYTQYIRQGKRKGTGRNQFERTPSETDRKRFLEGLRDASSTRPEVWRFLDGHKGLAADLQSLVRVLPQKPDPGFLRIGDTIWRDGEYLAIERGQNEVRLVKADDAQKKGFLESLSARSGAGDTAAQGFTHAHPNLRIDMLSFGIGQGAGKSRL